MASEACMSEATDLLPGVHLGCTGDSCSKNKSDYSETTMLKRPRVGSLVNSSSCAFSQQPTSTPATRMSCLACSVFR